MRRVHGEGLAQLGLDEAGRLALVLEHLDAVEGDGYPVYLDAAGEAECGDRAGSEVSGFAGNLHRRDGGRTARLGSLQSFLTASVGERFRRLWLASDGSGRRGAASERMLVTGLHRTTPGLSDLRARAARDEYYVHGISRRQAEACQPSHSRRPGQRWGSAAAGGNLKSETEGSRFKGTVSRSISLDCQGLKGARAGNCRRKQPSLSETSLLAGVQIKREGALVAEQSDVGVEKDGEQNAAIRRRCLAIGAQRKSGGTHWAEAVQSLLE